MSLQAVTLSCAHGAKTISLFHHIANKGYHPYQSQCHAMPDAMLRCPGVTSPGKVNLLRAVAERLSSS